MPELARPLNGAAYDGFVAIHETGPLGMITLRGDLSDPALQDTVRAVTGQDVPTPLGIAQGDRSVGWMSPDEVLLILPHDAVPDALRQIADGLGANHHLAVDVSDARASFIVSGAHAREVLAKLTPADVSPAALSPGTLRRTRLAQVPAAVWFSDAETAHIVCFRSVARYVFDLLCVSAKPGSEPGLYS